MRRKILIVVVGIFVFLVVFAVAIFVTFPTDSIRHFAEKQLEKALKQEQTVEIEEISISPLLNVTARGFKMNPRIVSDEAPLSTGGGTYMDIYYCAPYVEPMPFVVDEVFVKPSIFKSLNGKPNGHFELRVQDGLIEGDLQSRGEVMSLNAAGSNISLNEFALLSNMTKMQIFGDLAFSVDAKLAKSSLSGLDLKLNSLNTALCPKRIKLDMAGLPYIEIPFTVFGKVEAHLELKDDLLVIHSLTTDGPDIRLEVNGDVSLKKTGGGQALNIEAVILPSQEWLTENNMKVLYQVCEKHDDGSVHLSLRGTTKKIRHDCGTPIPEPVADTPAEPEKEAAEPEKKAAEPVKKAAPVKKAEPATPPEPVPANQPAPDSVMRPLHKLDGGEIEPNRTRPRNRPSAAGRTRSERLDRNGQVGGEPLMRNMDSVNENIDKEMRRRSQGRGEFQRRRGVDTEE
ncbi:MAG: type II secretion system protein GspN [Proteobacteria bacterium]|nr:type II secretion system protein GspN [Pseudomonadota bacterium]